MEYSAPVWDPHLAKDKTLLERTQRRAARWIKTDYSYKSSVTTMLQTLKLDRLEERRKGQRLTFMYKVLHQLVQVPPEDLGLEKADTRTRAAHSLKLKLPRCSTTELRHSFSIRTIPEWNKLPASMAEAGSLSSFKSQLAPLAP